VSVLVAAHDEEAVIERRIADLRELDYPADKSEVVVPGPTISWVRPPIEVVPNGIDSGLFMPGVMCAGHLSPPRRGLART
jgi:hypothetical protein